MDTPSSPTPVAPTPDRLLTASELATYLSVTRQTIYNLMDRGMPSLKVARARRFRTSAVDSWLDSQTDRASA